MKNNRFSFTKFDKNRSVEESAAIFEQRVFDAKSIYNKYSSEFVFRPCPVCGSEEYEFLEKFHDTYQVSRCSCCTTDYVNPCPSELALADYYNNYKCNEMLGKVYSRRAKQSDYIIDDRTAFVLKMLQDNPNNSINVLEVGCNSGGALLKLKEAIARDKILSSKSIQLSGIDLDSNAISNAVDPTLDLEAISAENLTEKKEGYYDLIIHYELIEHLIDPFSFLLNMRRLLKPGGEMFFSTPNADGLEMLTGYNGYRLLAHAIFPPMHLNAFSVKSIPLLSYRAGFKVSKISTPGSLDVDMLSVVSQFQQDDIFDEISALDDHAKGFLQYILVLLGASSHMQCVLRV